MAAIVARRPRNWRRIVGMKAKAGCGSGTDCGFLARNDAKKIEKDIVALGRMKTMQAMGLGRRQGGPVIAHEPTKEVPILAGPGREPRNASCRR